MRNYLLILFAALVFSLKAQVGITYYNKASTKVNIHSVHEVLQNSAGGYDIYCYAHNLLTAAIVQFDGVDKWVRKGEVTGGGYVASKGMVSLEDGGLELADATFDGNTFRVKKNSGGDHIIKGKDGNVYVWSRDDFGNRDSLYRLSSTGSWEGINISGINQTRINDVFVSTTGTIYLATSNGLATLEQGVLTITNKATDASFLTDDIRVVHQMDDGTLVLGTGIGYQHNAVGTWTVYYFSHGFYTVDKIQDAPNGKLWVAMRTPESKVAVVEVDLDANIYRGVVDSTATNEIFEDAIITELFVDNTGDVWVGLYQRTKLVRLHFDDPVSGFSSNQSSVEVRRAYPNPVDGSGAFNVKEGVSLVTMRSVDGVEVPVEYVNSTMVDVSQVKNGVYILHYADGKCEKLLVK